MTVDPLVDLSRADAPEYPDSGFADRLLDELVDQLSGPADPSITHEPVSSGPVLELKELEEMDTSAKKWLMPVLGAAAVLVLVVAGLVIASRDDDPPAPAEEPVSTAPAETAAPAEADDGTLAIGETLITALNERDTAAAAALLGDDAIVEVSSARNEDDLLRLIDFFAVDGTNFDIESCQPGSVYPVTCNAEFTNQLSQPLDGDPITATFNIRIADGQISALSLNMDRNFGEQVWDPWLAFIEEQHPDDFDKMILFLPDSPAPLGPQLTEESLTLHKAYIAEYIAEA